MLNGKAARINFGSLEFEALLSSAAGSNGKAQFYVAVPQAAVLFQFAKDHAQRDFKALLGESFQFAKMKTDLNPKAVNTMTLSQFEVLARKLDKKGNPIAIELVDSCLGLSLYQRACDSFGLKFEADDRSAWLIDRAAGKVARNKLTDSIKKWLDENDASDNARKFAYSNASDLLNVALTGHKASHWVAELGCDRHSLRDRLTSGTLLEFQSLESIAAKRINHGIEPMQAVRDALAFSYAKTIDHPFD